MYTWKFHGGKWLTVWGGLELRNKCHLNKEKGSCRLLRGEKMVLGKQKGPSEDSMGSLTVWDRVCLDAMPTFSLISCTKNPSSLLKTLPGGDWWWPSSFWRVWLKADEGDQSPPASAVFQCFQVKVISVPKQHMLGWHVLESFSHIFGAAYSASWKIQNYEDSQWIRGLGGGKDE